MLMCNSNAEREVCCMSGILFWPFSLTVWRIPGTCVKQEPLLESNKSSKSRSKCFLSEFLTLICPPTFPQKLTALSRRSALEEDGPFFSCGIKNSMGKPENILLLHLPPSQTLLYQIGSMIIPMIPFIGHMQYL